MASRVERRAGTFDDGRSTASLGFSNRSAGWLAQPGVYLYELTCGFHPQAQVVDSKPYYPTARECHRFGGEESSME